MRRRLRLVISDDADSPSYRSAGRARNREVDILHRGGLEARGDHGRSCRWGKALKATRDLLGVAGGRRGDVVVKNAREGYPPPEAEITRDPDVL